jgi:carbon storage regulator
MLVITRRVDEAVQIGHEISVRIVEVDGTKIRLGIDAPGDVSVRRIELESCDDCGDDLIVQVSRENP